MGKPVVHFEVLSGDARRAHEFYGMLFGWKIDASNPMQYGLVDTGDKKGIQGGIGQTDATRPPYVTFYVEVDDPQSYLDRATSLGGKVMVPVTEVPNMVTFAQFADPDGNVIGLVKSAPPAPRAARRKPARKKAPSRSRSRSRR